MEERQSATIEMQTHANIMSCNPCSIPWQVASLMSRSSGLPEKSVQESGRLGPIHVSVYKAAKAATGEGD